MPGPDVSESWSEAGTDPGKANPACVRDHLMTAGRAPELAGMYYIDTGTLRVAFPDWRIFHDTAGTWWALRAGLERQQGPESLLSRTLRAASPSALAEELCLQEWLDELDGEELAAVYRDMALPGATG
jgi:hypothetical protein